jgi:hypothetical protein
LSVIRNTPEPSGFIRWMSQKPRRLEVNAINSPSGDQAGPESGWALATGLRLEQGSASAVVLPSERGLASEQVLVSVAGSATESAWASGPALAMGRPSAWVWALVLGWVWAPL